jgi:hypothetical protein
MFARKHYDKNYLYETHPTQCILLQYKDEEGVGGQKGGGDRDRHIEGVREIQP